MIDPSLFNNFANADFIAVNPPHFHIAYPPSGMAYVLEAVRGAGFPTAALDLNAALYKKYGGGAMAEYWSLSQAGRRWNREYAETVALIELDMMETAASLANSGARVIGFSVNKNSVKAADDLARRIRAAAPDKVIVYGGYACCYPEICRVLSAEPDYICVGESEISAPALMKAVATGDDPGLVPGVMEIRAGSGRFTPGERAANLNTLLWPRWREFDMVTYRALATEFTLPINGSRGCSWGVCGFCSEQTATPGYRCRSAESLMEEISYHYENGARNFFFTDLIVNGDHEELGRFCDFVHAVGLKITLYGQFHIDKRMTPALFAKLRQAGMFVMNVGLETGSTRMMRLMKKGYDAALAERFLRHAKAAGFVVDINLVSGFPGETMEDVTATCEFLERNRDNIDFVDSLNLCAIVYGSPLWNEKEKYGVTFRAAPGETKKVRWASIDGDNDFEERNRRAEIIKSKIIELGFEWGQCTRDANVNQNGQGGYKYARFREKAETGIATVIKNSAPTRAVIFRSCGVDRVINVMGIIKSVAPEIKLDALIQASTADAMKQNGAAEIFEMAAGPMSVDNMNPVTLEIMRGRGYDLVVVPMGFMPEETYSHVFGLAEALRPKMVIAITPAGDAREIKL